MQAEITDEEIARLEARLERVRERLAALQLLAPVQRVTGFDIVFPLAQNEQLYLPNRERVMQAVRTTRPRVWPAAT